MSFFPNLEPPDGPPVIEGFTNRDKYSLIENNTLELTCSIKGGKPRPSLTWRCNDGAVVNESSGDETNFKVTWTAKRNNDGPCQCTSYHPAVSINRSVSVNVEILCKYSLMRKQAFIICSQWNHLTHAVMTRNVEVEFYYLIYACITI